MPRKNPRRKHIPAVDPPPPPLTQPVADKSWLVPLAVFGTVTLLAFGIIIGIRWLTAPSGTANASDPVQVALGERIYKEHCASCHGVQLEGQPNWRERRPDGRLPAPPHDATGHTWHHPDVVLFRITKLGPAAYGSPVAVSDMPAFDKLLSDQEIWAVLAYIKSRWPDDIRQRQERLPAKAK